VSASPPDPVHALAALDDDTRRRIYGFVFEADRPVTREDVAHAVGISRKLAAFHLDKLLDRGLLSARYARPAGRSGPGAGRPSKIYEPSWPELAVSIPERRYDLLSGILVGAVRSARASRSASAAARRRGVEIGRAAAEAATRRDARPPSRVIETLKSLGFEPSTGRRGDITLRNCPFAAVAAEDPAVVCSMNLALVSGIAQGAASGMHAEITRPPGACCVTLTP
jgi:predicted ArsR family transcriptional regulator